MLPVWLEIVVFLCACVCVCASGMLLVVEALQNKTNSRGVGGFQFSWSHTA